MTGCELMGHRSVWSRKMPGSLKRPCDDVVQPVENGRIVLGVTVGLSLGLLVTLVRRLHQEGWDVHVVCSPVGGDVAHLEGATIHELPMKRSISPAADLRAMAAWRSLLRDLAPDVVVGATPKAALLAMVTARTAKVPVRIFHVWGARWDGHSGTTAALLRAADRLTARCATDVISVSDSLAHLMMDHRIARSRPVVLGSGGWPGVDTERFRPGPAIQRGGAGPVVGYVGRLSVDKGIVDLLYVHSKVREIWPDARLEVVGRVDEAQPVDGDVMDQLRGPGIHWKEWIPKVDEVLRTWDVLLFPSIREGMPNVVIEAAASGLPVVGYRTTGVRDAVEDGVTGYLAPVGDSEALAKALIEVVSTDSAGMAAAARESASRRFSQSRVVGDFVDFVNRRFVDSATAPVLERKPR